MSPMDSSQARSAARKSITVVNKHGAPQFTIIGTTVFNNESEVIDAPGWSFSEHMAGVLRSRGYNAKVGEMNINGLNLVLYPIAPYGAEHQRGEGIYSRSVLKVGAGFEAHCHYRGSLVDKGQGLKKGQPVDFAGKGYFSSRTGN